MFFFTSLFSNIILIYLIAAVAPALILLSYVYNQQRYQSQPAGLIRHLIGQGMLAGIITIAAETFGTWLFNGTTKLQGSSYDLAFAVFVVGIIEEGMKFIFLKKNTWKLYSFQTKYDGIVYATSIGIGFAIFENVRYVFSYGMSTALVRAFTAIPGHLSFAVLMGVFYGQAKYYEDSGNKMMSVLNQIIAYACPVVLHGLYDGMAMINTRTSNLIFFLILIVIYIIIFRLVRHEAETDKFV